MDTPVTRRRKPLRIYADTSVFGGVGDDEFAAPSRAFFARVRQGQVILLVSRITYDELDAAPESVRAVLAALPQENVEQLPVNVEAISLADAYEEHGALGPGSRDDALHVATATVGQADAIVSWNFRHLVNLNRIRKFNGVNALMGHGTIEIRSPLELGNAHEDEEG
jgi:predicted nucleic acid-binding protein